MNIDHDVLNEELNKKVESFIYWSLYMIVFTAIVSVWLFALRHDLHCLFQKELYKHLLFDIFSICGFTALMTPLIHIFVVILFPFTYILKLNKSIETILK